jgi:hypothetical protein
MLRQRVLSQLAAGAMVAILIFSGLYVFITQSYQRLERQTLELDRQRVLNALDMQIERIDGWAQSGFIEYSAATSEMTVYRDFGVDTISGSFDIAEVVLFKSDGQFLVGRAADPTLELSDSPLDEMSPLCSGGSELTIV